jgi:hypothetical protein
MVAATVELTESCWAAVKVARLAAGWADHSVAWWERR